MKSSFSECDWSDVLDAVRGLRDDPAGLTDSGLFARSRVREALKEAGWGQFPPDTRATGADESCLFRALFSLWRWAHGDDDAISHLDAVIGTLERFALGDEPDEPLVADDPTDVWKPVGFLGIEWNAARREIRRDGTVVSFGGYEIAFRIAVRLLRERGGVAPFSALQHAGWSDDPAIENKSIHDQVSHIRPRFAELGLEAVNTRKQGYSAAEIRD